MVDDIDTTKLPREFDQVDLENAWERCKVLPVDSSGVKWDWDRFVEWLNVPANEQLIINQHGVDYKLRQALDMLNAPAISNTTGSRNRMRRQRERRKLADAFTDEQHGPPRNKMNVPSDRVKEQEEELPIELPSVKPEEVEAKLKELLASQTDVQAQDITTARRGIQAELLVDKYYVMLQGQLKPAFISVLNLAIEKQSKIALDCWRTLGIDRAKRQADADKRSDVDSVMAIIEEAGKWAQEQAIRIVHCDTLIGWVLLEFRERPLSVSATCPKCNERFCVDHLPSQEDIAGAVEPAWIADEENAYDPGDENATDQLPTTSEPEQDQG